MSEKVQVKDNSDQHRFELNLDGKTAFVDYILNSKGVIFLTHTEVPKELEGKGIASKMIHSVLSEIESRQLKLVPICPFVKAYLSRHPEWKRLLDEHHRF